MKKLTSKKFIELLKDGPVQIGKNIFYMVVKMNDKEVSMGNILKEQLKKEGLYNNSYVGVIVDKKQVEQEKITVDCLPIFGNPNKYETKHLSLTFDDAVKKDTRSRQLGLLERQAYHSSML